MLALAALALALPLGTLAGVRRGDPRNTARRHGDHPRSGRRPLDPELRHRDFPRLSLRVKLSCAAGRRLGQLDQAVLPIVILAIPSAAYIARLTRTFMLEVLQQDYMRTARAKGLPTGW